MGTAPHERGGSAHTTQTDAPAPTPGPAAHSSRPASASTTGTAGAGVQFPPPPARPDGTRGSGRGMSGAWRLVDIVVSAVLGVATGLLFWAYNTPGNALFTWADALLPGVGGLANGIWLLGGPIGGLVIRKPGAAIFVETLAAIVSAVLGNQWGWSTVWIGIAQGVGAEIAFLLFLYRRGTLDVALLSGALAGVGSWAYSWITGGLTKTTSYNIIYIITSAVSGAIAAGLLAWLITRSLAETGVLSAFPSGRRRTV